MIPLQLNYRLHPESHLRPEHAIEFLTGDHLEGDEFRLTTHSVNLALGPGDIVTAHENVITGVEHLSDDWLIEVFLKDNDAEVCAERWRRDVPATVVAPMVVRLSSSTKDWVDTLIVTDPRVDAIDVIRRPGAVLTFEEIVTLP